MGGPLLYHAFLDAQILVTKEVPTRPIPTELNHDALATEVSSRQGIWTRKQAEDFLEDYFARDRQPFHSSFRGKMSSWLAYMTTCFKSSHQV